ncbi:MAG: hypothetical protein RRX93_00520 [Bacteroidales bacterium]
MYLKRCYSYTTPKEVQLQEKAFLALVDFIYHLKLEKEIPFKIYIAIAKTDRQSLYNLQQDFISYLSNVLDSEIPALTLVCQAPKNGAFLCAEIFCVSQKDLIESHSKIYFKQFNKLPYIEIQSKTYCELWSSGFQSSYSSNQNTSCKDTHTISFLSTEQASIFAFEQMQALLAYTNFCFDHIFRQWNYIGHILKIHKDKNKELQNYQIFNEVRERFYSRYKKEKTYPAATGIGMNYNGICIDFIACSPISKNAQPAETSNSAENFIDYQKSEIYNLPLKSLVQKDAYSYNQQVLIGQSIFSNIHKKTPLFERARLWIETKPDGNICMVSGTASIEGEKTIDENNAEKQLINTIQFINSLVQPQSVEIALQVAKNSNPLLQKKILESTPCFTRIRLYVKPGFYTELLGNLLKKNYLSTAAISLVEAEICRNNLLIEIEADLTYKENSSIKEDSSIAH